MSLWRRRQLFEFQDQPWFPDVLREGQVEILSLATERSGLAQALAPAFADFVAQAGPGPILDLCSGGGGPVVALLQALANGGHVVPPVVLSDLFPKIDAWRALCARLPAGLDVDFVPRPVDATRLGSDLDARAVTIVNGLHHFPQEKVHAIIAQVAARGAALFVSEGFPRSVLRASALVPALGLSWLENPFRCAARGPQKALWSFGLPVLTVTGLWDWLASALRIHEPAELLATARSAAPHHRWSGGEAPFAGWGQAIYLAGLPR